MQKFSKIGLASLALYALAWLASMAFWVSTGKSLEVPLAVLIIFGLALPAIAYILTLRLPPLAPVAARSSPQMIFVALYVAFVAVHLAFFHGPAVDYVTSVLGGGEPARHFAKVIVKLTVFVIVPAAVMLLAFGRSLSSLGWQQLGAMLKSRYVLTALLLGGAAMFVNWMIGQHEEVAAAARSTPHLQFAAGLLFTFAWLMLEVGLVEELFFRGIVQSTIEAWTQSPLAGVFLSALAFGLAHAPGLISGRSVDETLGTAPGIIASVAYTVLVLGVASWVFGMIWLRTRNLLLLMFVHVCIDVLPSYTETVRAFGLFS